MGKNIQYGEFTFAPSPTRQSKRSVSTAKSTKGIPKAMYDAPHAMKNGGMCKSTAGYAKGGPKMPAKREPEAMVRKEVALLRKAGAPKALISHEVREMSGEMDTPATKKAEVKMMRKAKAPLTMLKHEMSEPIALKKGGSVEAKLEKHANMPASKAHGSGAGNKLAKGGVPTFSKVPKFGRMK
jgi:hypothetical protein